MTGKQALHSYIATPLDVLENLSLQYSRWSRFLSHHSPHAFASRAFWRTFFFAMPDTHPIVITEVRQDDDLVALIWGGLSTVRATGGLREQRLVAYRSGIPCVDKIWPEMNSLMRLSTCQYSERDILRAWHRRGGVSTSEWHAIYTRDIPQGAKEERRDVGGEIDLSLPYAPSASIRRAIRQTQRYVSQHYANASLSITPHTGESAWQCVVAHKNHHIQKWSGTDTPSGLSEFTFCMILKRWLCAFDSNLVVYEISAGKNRLGMVIMLQERHTWRYYLSSFTPALKGTNSNHYHPGYWAHHMLAQRAQQAGVQRYDFMAGEQRFKTQFSNIPLPEYTRVVYRTGTTMYALALHVKRLWKRATTPLSAGVPTPE